LPGEPEFRPVAAEALRWVARVTAIGLEFAVPALVGRLLDLGLGTGPWLVVSGALLGLAVGMLHVLRLPEEFAREAERDRGRRSGSERDSP